MGLLGPNRHGGAIAGLRGTVLRNFLKYRENKPADDGAQHDLHLRQLKLLRRIRLSTETG